MYHTINSDYKNKLIQERLLSILLVANYKKSYKSFDAVRNDLAVEFPASKYLKYIDSLKTNFTASKLSSKDALATIVTDQKGNPFALNQIIKDKPLFIDCWASWCVPCLQQFPFSKELETKYKGKIDFAYLSFDKDKAKWIDKARRLFLDENSYLIDNNFSSSFANYFNISSIPRYIILDSKGNIVDKDAPRPTRKEALTKILDNLLAKDEPGKNWKILSEYKINKLDTVKWGDKLINHRN
jgi:thiol-disulfide isomerase/thioredoxin